MALDFVPPNDGALHDAHRVLGLFAGLDEVAVEFGAQLKDLVNPNICRPQIMASEHGVPCSSLKINGARPHLVEIKKQLPQVVVKDHWMLLLLA